MTATWPDEGNLELLDDDLFLGEVYEGIGFDDDDLRDDDDEGFGDDDAASYGDWRGFYDDEVRLGDC